MTTLAILVSKRVELTIIQGLYYLMIYSRQLSDKLIPLRVLHFLSSAALVLLNHFYPRIVEPQLTDLAHVPQVQERTHTDARGQPKT